MPNTATSLPGFLQSPTRFLFFTGKGGVGKTSIASASALTLAAAAKRVLLISTDPASNLDEILGIPLRNDPVPVPGAAGLEVLNIDPTAAAERYRARVIAQMGTAATAAEKATVKDQLWGACTTEIAAFDEFVDRIADDNTSYDHIIFDTAPTGHTLRLLSLPKAWSGFLDGNDRGASCLGPHSGLKMQEARFKAAVVKLGDAAATTIVLVTRPEDGAIKEAARTSAELRVQGLANQRLVVNGVFTATNQTDAVAVSLQNAGRQALEKMPPDLRTLPRDDIALRPMDMLGLDALRGLLKPAVSTVPPAPDAAATTDDLPPLGRLIDDLAAPGRGLVMVMGKGGVGKTTIAAGIAIGLVARGHTVHLTTTDPAAHIETTLMGSLPNLRVSRIDPAAETARYIAKMMERNRDLDAAGQALLREDLASPCTEEVAVFHAFSRIVAEARDAFVVLDTAPTGHSLLLMDATGAYHNQMMRSGGAAAGAASGRMITPMMRLQDPDYSRVVLVTLAETTPVSQASALQDDLRRAKIEPFAWIINKSLVATGTRDPLLRARLGSERRQIARVRGGLAQRCFFLPWQPSALVGVDALRALGTPETT